MIGNSAVTVDFAALKYFNQPGGTVLVGEQTAWPVTITNATRQEPAGMILAADGRSLHWQPAKVSVYEAVIAADDGTTIVTKTLTLSVVQDRQAAYDQVHATVGKEPYSTKLTQANAAVMKLFKAGSTDDFP